ncbi:hypothetical protein J6N69_03150 [bacterium]|nr:hypothetical protein [bacterium]
MNLNSLKKILSALLFVSLIQIPAFSVEDVWGSSMGITEDAIKQNSASNTVIDASNAAPAPTQNLPSYTEEASSV